MQGADARGAAQLLVQVAAQPAIRQRQGREQQARCGGGVGFHGVQGQLCTVLVSLSRCCSSGLLALFVERWRRLDVAGAHV